MLQIVGTCAVANVLLKKHHFKQCQVGIDMPRLSNVSRERAIGMLQNGATQAQVAASFNVARITISRLWNRFQTLNSTADRPRSGRPRVTTPRQDRLIQLRHARNRFEVPARTAGDIPGLRRISRRTVTRRLQEAGLRSRRPYRGPMLTPRHCRARLQWCRRHLRWRIGDWHQVLFTDESRFTVRHADGRTRVYRRVHERYTDPCVLRHDRFGGGSVMVWGGIATNRRTELVVIPGNLNAQRYREDILTPHVLPFMQAHGGIFQQDNARPHVARANMHFLAVHNVDVLPWPAYSPDFSPIEHLWDELNRQVRRRPQQPESVAQLTQALQEEWQRIPMVRINRLIASMRRRCQAAIDNRGSFTRY